MHPIPLVFPSAAHAPTTNKDTKEQIKNTINVSINLPNMITINVI